MPGHVADDDSEAVFKHGHNVEVIAPSRVCGERAPRDIQSRQGGSAFGKEMLLNFARHAKLLLVFPQLLFCRLAFGDITKKNDEPELLIDLNIAVGGLHGKFRATPLHADGFTRAPFAPWG